MNVRIFAAAAVALMVMTAPPSWALDKIETSPPGGAYKAVSTLVKLPDFVPGMGQLFVDPAALPAGPFLAYDHKGKLVSTVYMLPLKDLKPDMNLGSLKSPGPKVDHVSVTYNAGHPGVEMPHVHVILWHLSVADEALVAK